MSSICAQGGSASNLDEEYNHNVCVCPPNATLSNGAVRHASSIGATLLVNLASGVVAGTLASFVTHPFDVVKTRAMASQPSTAGATHSTSTYAGLKEMLVSEGPSALWRGLVSA